jgi:hypothetical protein
MLRIKQSRFLGYLLVAGLFGILTACGGGGGGGGDDGPVFYPNVPPQNVQVVSGDGATSVMANVISWTDDPAATGHTVYWSYDPGLTENDQQVVPGPGETTSTYMVHSDPTEVFPGQTIYYLVVATDGVQVSVPSAEVYGTPQPNVTGNSLNDVAWNGEPVDGSSLVAMVAVGDSGTILTSPNGILDGWEDVDLDLVLDDVDVSLAGVTWGNSQFVVVGAGGTVLTSPDGTNWTLQDVLTLQGSEFNTDLEDVVWTGSGYVVVGKNGAVLTGSADGTAWTVQSPGADDAITLEGVAEGNGTLVAVGTKGTIITSLDDGVTWVKQDLTEDGIYTTNDLSDITWNGSDFGVVGSDSTLLSSSDGLTWIEHTPDIYDYALEGAVQWDPFLPASIPPNPILSMVGSSGTFFVADSLNDSGFSVPTATNAQLEAVIWVDREGDAFDPYFLMVGHEGTVLTNQYKAQ